MFLVGTGGAIATSLNSLKAIPMWLPITVVCACALLAVFYTHHFCQPRKIDELPSKLLKAIVIVPVAALLVWTLIAIVT